MKYKYLLRPHHAMCIAFFKGEGYSNEFTANMRKMIKELEDNPNICVSAQSDVICEKCPNNIKGICKTEDKVAEYDRQVLERCGLTEGVIMPYKLFRKRVAEHILLANKRTEICGSCQWNALCNNVDTNTI